MSTEQERYIQEVNSRIDRIEVTLSHAVDAIEKMADVVNKPQETKWGPILTAVGLLFMAGGGYTTLITQPMREDIARLEQQNQDQLIRELQHAREFGRIEGIHGVEGVKPDNHHD